MRPLYSRSELLAAATQGATIGSDYTQNLNETALTGKLEEYSDNLVAAIREQHPNSSVAEVLGGRTIIQSNLENYQTTLPFATEGTVVWDDIPTAKTASIKFVHAGINHTLAIPEIAGKRLTLTYSPTGFRPELRLDGVLVASGNSTAKGSTNDLVVTVDHPYASNNGTYIDQTSTYKPVSGATYAIVSNFGGFSNDLIDMRQKKLAQALASGLPETSEAVLGETLNTMGHGWMQECRLADQLLAQLAGTISVRHHSIGMMAQEEG
jgi:hypothetical protein